jgi:hypothetical protein
MTGPKLPTITMPAGSYTTQWDTTRACGAIQALSALRVSPPRIKTTRRHAHQFDSQLTYAHKLTQQLPNDAASLRARSDIVV